MHIRLLLVAIIVGCGGAFHYGFQLVITNPSQKAFINFENSVIEKHYSKYLSINVLDDIWSITVALFSVGAIIGALSINYVSKKLGRKRALIVTYFLSIISLGLAVISYFTKTFELYAFSRITLGFSNTLSLAIGALYLSEISPRHLRGRVGMASGVSVQLGLVIGALVAMPNLLGSIHRWWIIYLGESILLIFALFFILFFPESPDFLAAKNSDDQAKNSIMFFHQISESDAICVVEELKLSNNLKSSKMGLFEIWKYSETRKRTIISMSIAFGAMFSGIEAINAFATDILESVGLSNTTSAYVNLGLSLMSLVTTLSLSMVIDKFGRRLVLIFAFIGILFCNIFIGSLLFAHGNHPPKIISILLIFCIGIFFILYSSGPGPLAYFITAELNELNTRSAAQSWTSFIQMTSRAILIAIFLPLKSAIGGAEAYLLLFVIPIISVIIFLYFNLPETKNKTQKELDEEFKKLPTIGCSSFCRRYIRKPKKHNKVLPI